MIKKSIKYNLFVSIAIFCSFTNNLSSSQEVEILEKLRNIESRRSSAQRQVELARINDELAKYIFTLTNLAEFAKAARTLGDVMNENKQLKTELEKIQVTDPQNDRGHLQVVEDFRVLQEKHAQLQAEFLGNQDVLKKTQARVRQENEQLFANLTQELNQEACKENRRPKLIPENYGTPVKARVKKMTPQAVQPQHLTVTFLQDPMAQAGVKAIIANHEVALSTLENYAALIQSQQVEYQEFIASFHQHIALTHELALKNMQMTQEQGQMLEAQTLEVARLKVQLAFHEKQVDEKFVAQEQSQQEYLEQKQLSLYEPIKFTQESAGTIPQTWSQWGRMHGHKIILVSAGAVTSYFLFKGATVMAQSLAHMQKGHMIYLSIFPLTAQAAK